MLKSFEYAEPELLNEVSDNELLAEERSIAKSFFESRKPAITERACPACAARADKDEVFMEIFGAGYRRCPACASLFVLSESIADYTQYPPLRAFRRSARFQTSSPKRTAMWNEYLFWLRFRSMRYLGGLRDFNILDWENPFRIFSEMIESAEFCSNYARKSLEFGDGGDFNQPADVAVYHDSLPGEANPKETLMQINALLRPGGLLVIGTRVGTGFDVLVLRGDNSNIFPCKYAFLPSLRGAELLLKQCGFETLEVSTPGSADVEYVLSHKEKITDPFVRQLIQESDGHALSDFQRFLQKSGLSSYARIVARKKY